MKFKTAALQVEFDGLHPEVRRGVSDLDKWSVANGIPEVVVTHVFRTKAFQEETYWPAIAKRLAAENPKRPVGEIEAEARAEARKKFSWHLVHCAIDIRNRHYSPDQRRRVMGFLQRGRAAPIWEVLEHDVGRGDHIHLGIRDFSWRSLHTPKE